ncbi:hypothetical protein [Taibaiella koreensis]|uniref:hypothetical protein n=1 Tax=Taibaiella koreensis TaxID=1268548 RepID=UPI000E59936A|nr:hypothetical protein [Taibaiella koreensis]
MKLITISVVLFGFLSNATAQKTDFIVCTWVVAEGAQVYNIILSENNRTIDSLYNQIEQSSFHKYTHVRQYIVSTGALQYISEYITAHCNSETNLSSKSQDEYHIGYRINKDALQCYIEKKDRAIPYFKSLIDWIKKSKYSSECAGFVSSLKQHYIEGKGFPYNRLDQVTFENTLKRKGQSK